MNEELKNLNRLSEESWKKLLEYFENNTLSLQERCSLLNEITGHKDMLMERSFKD
jgi:F0F1-type ATP synthase delta subunit